MQNSLESALYQRHFDDGLIDVMAGLCLLGIGIGWMLAIPLLSIFAPLLIWPFWQPLRRALIIPRLGNAEFAGRRQSRTRKGMSMMTLIFTVSAVLGVGAFMFANGVLGDPAAISIHMILAIPALIIALAAGVTYFIFGISRFLVYAVALVLAAFVFHILLESRPGADMAVGSILPILWGGLRLAQTLRLPMEPQQD